MKKETQQLSLTRALAKVKLYDSKINSAIDAIKPVALEQNHMLTTSTKTPKDFINDYQSKMNALTTLRANQTALRNAITKANAETIVVINGLTYTIVEAIKLKSDIDVDRQLLQKLVKYASNANSQVEKANAEVEESIQRTINSKSSSSGQIPKDFIESTTKSIKELNWTTICNEKVVEEDIHKLSDYISNFVAEVDMCLSEVNASTFIEIDLANEE